MSYTTRWLFSTSHKDIGILYLIYGMISAMVATAMSVIIRLELSGPGDQFLHENRQVYNVLVTGHAIAMIFLFVMPVLIGAFLRREQLVSAIIVILLCNVMIILWFAIMDGLMRLNSLHEYLSTEGLANELISEGCTKWGKIQTLSEVFSTLDIALVVILSLMRMNPYYKIGSAILGSSEINSRSKSFIYERNKDECIYFKSIIRSTKTEEDLIFIQDGNSLKAYLTKHGNLGKGILLKWNNVKFHILKSWFKVTVIYLYVYSLLGIVRLYNLFIISFIQIINRIHGGKISEEAKVLSNVRNTIKHQSRDRLGLQWPRVEHIGQKLNSRCLSMNELYIQKRSYSKTREDISEFQLYLKSVVNGVFVWPNSFVLGHIRKVVHEQQMELVHLANIHGAKSELVMKRQMMLVNSIIFRLHAVDKLSHSRGSLTSGVDNVCIEGVDKDRALLVEIVEWLGTTVKHPKLYKSDPVKRVWIPKGNEKLRPIGIPTLKDRGLQYLINLVVEPLVEMTSDPHNYGFRPYRSTKNAIAYLRSHLHTIDSSKKGNHFTTASNVENNLLRLLPENKWILDADIKGFFDNINHDWLLNNLTLHPKLLLIIKAWLKSGVIDGKIFQLTESGTPQGGVISPTLVNFTLNGLEKVVMEALYPLTKSKEQRIRIKLKDGTYTCVASSLAYVRYADDFVVLVRSKHIMLTFIKPAIEKFLAERGLNLNEEKTKLFRLSDPGCQLDFLGYTFKYQDKWSIKRHVFYHNHAGSRGIALYPNKTKVLSFIEKLKLIFKKSMNLDAYNLITKLNPILRGWSNYYNMGNSSHYRDTVRNSLYHLIWRWAHRKHRRWNRHAIAKTYFLTAKVEGTKLSNTEYSMFKNVKWVFHGKTSAQSRYNVDKTKLIYLVDVGNVSQLLAAKYYNIPHNLIHIHAYHNDYMKIVEYNTNVNFKALGVNAPFKQKLLIRQNNLCPVCQSTLTESSVGWTNVLHIHHINPIAKGGARNKLDNLILVHSWCHKDLHRVNRSHKNEIVL